MSEPPDLQEINTRLAVLEERMNTLKAENTSAQERLNATLERFHTAMAELKTENAKRDKDNQRWIIGLVLGCTAIVVGAIALL